MPPPGPLAPFLLEKQAPHYTSGGLFPFPPPILLALRILNGPAKIYLLQRASIFSRSRAFPFFEVLFSLFAFPFKAIGHSPYHRLLYRAV